MENTCVGTELSYKEKNSSKEIKSSMSRRGYRRGYRLTKRGMDVICSLMGIIILSPVFLITAIAIYLEDHGPVFYIQERIGMNKKKFNMYKFRSMYMNADEIHEQLKKEYQCDEISFKLKKDPRVTGMGHIIRKFNIDELPQLFNIIKGDMTIVGPRPLPVYEYNEEQKKYKGKYDVRYSVPQGLTCYWQISNRSEPDFADRMQMDVDYAENCSFGGDMKLIVNTFFKTVCGNAEY